MANKKGFNWKGLGIGVLCVALGAGLTVGVTEAVKYVQNNQEQTEETPEDKTTPGTGEETVEGTVLAQYAEAVDAVAD